MELFMPTDRTIEEMRLTSVLRDRRIFLCEEIDRESVFKIFYWLDRLKALDKKTNTKEPIEIILDCYGGCAYSTITLCSKIKSMIKEGYNIITTVHTVGFSGAFWILISGSERRAFSDSRLMVHNVLGGTNGKHQDMIEDLEEVEKLWNKLKEIIVENTNITDEKMDEIKKTKYDWYFWGKDALDLKIIDYLL